MDEKLAQLTGGRGVDLVLETSGSAFVQANTVKYVALAGTITFVGFNKGEDIAFDVSTFMRKEARATSVFRYRNQHLKAINELIAHPIPIESIISDEYALEDLQKALDENIAKKDKIIKAVVKM